MNLLKDNKFSIILATKNSIDNLKKTITSIKLQNYQNYELIVIDGQSKDGTKEYLDNEKKNINLIYKSEPDESLVDAYDKGWKLATGDIIFPIATDERLFDKNVLNNINDQFKHYNDKFFLIGNIGFMNEKEELIEISKPFGGNKDNLKFDLMSHLACETVLPMHSTFFKRKIIENIKFDLDVKQCGDYFFVANLLSKHNYSDFIFFDVPVLKALKTRISSSYRSENFELMIQSKISSLEKFCKLNKNLIHQDKLNSIKAGIYIWAVEQISVMDNINSLCMNYLNQAIKFDSKNERVFKFMRFHGIESREGRLIYDDDISENIIKKTNMNFNFLIKNHHSFFKKFYFKFKKKEFFFNTEPYGKLLDIKIEDKNRNFDFKKNIYWIRIDIFLNKGRIALSKIINPKINNEILYKEKYFINENNDLSIFYKLDNMNDLFFRIRNFGEYKSRFILKNISLYYSD